MHILLLDPHYWFDFAALGHRVSTFSLTDYETPLERILETLPVPPDCIIQQERLGARLFVTGLESAPCPTLYQAFDAHLNLYWQQHYARLFDAVLTPHLTLFEALPPENRHPQVFRLLPVGRVLPWINHARRQHPLAFCGRITPDRPLRAAMTSLLQSRFGLALEQEIPQESMFRFYRDARIIPNEAICFEVNMRLFEGASAGAALLTPDCGPDQLAAFTDGEEMLLYHDGLELCEKAAWLLRNPEAAETMGKKARKRVLRFHLPTHRAAFIRDILPTLGRARATGADAAAFAWLARMECAKAGEKQLPVSRLLALSEQLPDEPGVLTGILHLLGAPSRQTAALELCRGLLRTTIAAGHLPCNAAASACALAHGDTDLARQLYARQFPQENAAASPSPDFSGPASSGDASPGALCRAWARALADAGYAVRPGFAFQPAAGHLPACAHEFLTFARKLPSLAEQLDPEERIRLIAGEDALLQAFPAYAAYRLSLLKSLPPSRRDMREIAELLLFCCRVDEGLALREGT